MDEYLTLAAQDLPEKLASMPGELSVWGNVALLSKPAVGICGSRKASEHGLAYAYELGELAAQYSLVVVSGYAAGVDQQAHTGAMEAGGETIAVLAEGMTRFSVRAGLRDVLSGSNFLAVSEFPPNAMWTSWRAMQRNSTIVQMTDAMFVVEAGETGGTLEAGKSTLEAGKPLFVLEFLRERPATKGNRMLLERGGIPVANMRDLKHALEQVKAGDMVVGRRLL